MKKLILPILTIALFWTVAAAEKTGTPAMRFYGKITAINTAQKNVTVHNQRQDMDAVFQWNDGTDVRLNKKDINATDLKVGQSLMVSYTTEGNANVAKLISVRTPFKKSAQVTQ